MTDLFADGNYDYIAKMNGVNARLRRANAIIGGDFGLNPWQRGVSFAGLGSGSGYTADRWRYVMSSAGVLSITKAASAPTVAQAGRMLTDSLRVAVTTADAAVAAGDYAVVQQQIEGYVFRHFAQQPMYLRFAHAHSKVGVYCVRVANNAGTKSYVHEYTQQVADAWEYEDIEIPATPSSGVWEYTTSTGLVLSFALMAGTTYQAAAGAWQDGNFYATGNQANALDSTANSFRLADVSLVPGYKDGGGIEYRDYLSELALCQRYFQKSFPLGTAPAQSAGTAGAVHCYSTGAHGNVLVHLRSRMRVSPSIVTYNPSVANANWRDASNSLDRTASTTAVGDFSFTVFSGSFVANAHNYIHWSADSEL